MPTDKELDNLIKIFTGAREQLLDTIINYQGVGTKVYANTIYKRIEVILDQLGQATGKYAETAIPKQYQDALDEVYNYFKSNNLLMKPPMAFAQVHTATIYGIAREMQYLISEGVAQVGRQILRYVDESRDEALRAAGLLATGEKLASGGTVGKMQKNLLAKLQEQGFMTVQYGSGLKAYQVPLDAYASMVARSTTREAGNIAREKQLEENGYDLMKMSTHYPTCELCAPLQGRVYSISGNDARFPAISRAYRNGYRNVHPNCRHVMTPYIESLQEESELQADIEASNQPFEDPRPEVERNLYNKQQAQNRQARQDLYQYERYKARLGEEAPKTFSAFRRLKNKGGEPWEDLRYYYKYKGDRPTYCVKIDRELDKLGIGDKGRAFPADNNFEVKSWHNHAKTRLKAAGLTEDEALRWKTEAKIMFRNYPPGKTLLNFYHEDGIIGIKEENNQVRTVIDKARFLNNSTVILGAIKKHVN